MPNNKRTEFWITNITKMNVCLSDLRLTVPARRSMNLLDEKHFYYTLEQLEQSAKDGSLFRKNDRIKVRKVPPPEEKNFSGIYISKEPLFLAQKNLHSQVVIEEPKFEELEISETEFADEFTQDE